MSFSNNPERVAEKFFLPPPGWGNRGSEAKWLVVSLSAHVGREWSLGPDLPSRVQGGLSLGLLKETASPHAFSLWAVRWVWGQQAGSLHPGSGVREVGLPTGAHRHTGTCFCLAVRACGSRPSVWAKHLSPATVAAGRAAVPRPCHPLLLLSWPERQGTWSPPA